ncbi:MAG: oligosaccharide repeat unit polymerase [Cyclobacteriaceae bacterium]|nr:oligosaccharide repeat unit polymerase [Cyclobacteriaceae bacterium]
MGLINFFESLLFKEGVLYVFLTLVPLAILLKNYRSKDPVQLYSPVSVLCLLFLYYTIVGPTVLITNGLAFYKSVDHRPVLFNGLLLSSIAFISFIVGYQKWFRKKWSDTGNNDFSLSVRFSKYLFFVIFISVVLTTSLLGITVNLFTTQSDYLNSVIYNGVFKNYIHHLMDALIGVILLFLLSYLVSKKNLYWLVFAFLFAVIVFITDAFRWRIVILGLSFALTYLIYHRKRINLFLSSGIFVAIIVFFGVIEFTRNYGRGLDTEQLNTYSPYQYFLGGFYESSVFFATGLLVEKVPNEVGFIGFEPLIQTLLFPVPRAVWPEKSNGSYISIYQDLYPSKALGKGVAVLGFGEYYLAFGYPGVILGCFILGVLFGNLWAWFKINIRNPIAIAIYAISTSFLYMIISRGYLPQVVMLFFFTVGPVLIFYFVIKSKKELVL